MPDPGGAGEVDGDVALRDAGAALVGAAEPGGALPVAACEQTGLEPGRLAPGAAPVAHEERLDAPPVAGRGGQRGAVVGRVEGAPGDDLAAVPDVGLAGLESVGEVATRIR